MRSVKFTLIVPTYQGYQSVGKCMSSIAAQTDSSFECLVINDGVDKQMRETIERAAPFATYHERPFYGRKGGGMSIDYGLSIAKGEFVYILNGDNTIEPGFVEKMYNPEAHILTCQVWMNDEPGVILHGKCYAKGRFDRANYAIITPVAQKIGDRDFAMLQQDDWHWFNACWNEIQSKGDVQVHHVNKVLATHN